MKIAKKIIALVIGLYSFLPSNGQNLVVENFKFQGDYSFINSIAPLKNNQFLTKIQNDLILYQGSIIQDTLAISGNLFALKDGTCLIETTTDIYVYDNGQLILFEDQNNTLSISILSAEKLDNGKLLVFNRSGALSIELIVMETNNFQVIHSASDFPTFQRDIVEYENGKYSLKVELASKNNIFYDEVSESVSVFSDSIYTGSSSLLRMANGPGDTLYLLIESAILKLLDEQIVEIEYFVNSPLFRFTTLEYTANSKDGQYLGFYDQFTLVLYNGRDFVEFDTADGVPFGLFNPEFYFDEGNNPVIISSDGNFHRFKSGFINSINDIEEDNVKFYPNPSKGVFYLEGLDNINPKSIKLKDINGREVLINTSEVSSDKRRISLGDGVVNGIYFLELINNTSSLIRKKIIIVE